MRHQSPAYLAPVEYIEKELAGIRSQCYLYGQPTHGMSGGGKAREVFPVSIL